MYMYTYMWNPYWWLPTHVLLLDYLYSCVCALIRMQMFIHNCMYVCIYIRTYIHTHIYICTYLLTYIYTYIFDIYIYIHIFMYISTYTYIHTYIYTCIYTYMYMYIHAHIFDHYTAYTHTPTYIDARTHVYINMCACAKGCKCMCIHAYTWMYLSYRTETFLLCHWIFPKFRLYTEYCRHVCLCTGLCVFLWPVMLVFIRAGVFMCCIRVNGGVCVCERVCVLVYLYIHTQTYIPVDRLNVHTTNWNRF